MLEFNTNVVSKKHEIIREQKSTDNNNTATHIKIFNKRVFQIITS